MIRKSAIATALLLFVSTANADPIAWTGTFNMYDGSGGQLDADGDSPDMTADVTGVIDVPAGTFTLASTDPFFGLTWSTSGGTLFQPGTYTHSTVDGVDGDPNDGVDGGDYNFTVGAGQLGAIVDFSWGTTTGIDVLMIWDVANTGQVFTYTMTDPDGDGIDGTGMIDGPFPGFNANFNMTLTDSVAPDITLLGSATVTTGTSDTYADAGATALDNLDGVITADIDTVNPVNQGLPGNYTVTYNVSDTAGNAATEVTRTVTVFDNTPPVITVYPTSVSIGAGSTYTDTLTGVTASDLIDGDITADIVVGGDTVDTAVPGTYVITYDVSDSAPTPNAATQVTRTVTVTNGDAPVITLNGNSTINLNEGDAYVELGATATDTEDGDVTANIVITGTVNTSIPGSYNVTYNAADLVGNPATPVVRTVIVHDITPPTISVSGSAVLDVEAGSTYTDAGATASDTNDGDITGSIVTINPVNTSAALGTIFTITYNVDDAAGNSAAEATRIVTIVDTTAPTISIIGNTTVSLYQGQTYTDAGATATDFVDGTVTVTTDNPVDTATVGNYTVTYTATDTTGNTATSTRTVSVLDNTSIIPVEAPVLTANQVTDTRVIVTGGGDVTVSTDFSATGNTFDWNATNNNLVPVDATFNGSTFTFDPSTVNAGLYEVSVTVNANTVDEATGTMLLRVITTAPTLATDVDTDGDGTFDSDEGFDDSDNDGIPDFADDSSLVATQIKVAAGIMTSSTGTLRLGTTAFASGDLATGAISPQINSTDIVSYGGIAGTAPANGDDTSVVESCVGGCFDFEVANITAGGVIQVVLPLSAPIPENATYRLYTPDSGWKDFIVTANEAIASAATVNGICPAPNASGAWIDGLFPGDTCIRLTVQDGGANDADGLANGTFVDPAGVAEITPVSTVNSADDSQAIGCSATNIPVNPLDRSDWWLVAIFLGWLAVLRTRSANKQ